MGGITTHLSAGLSKRIDLTPAQMRVLARSVREEFK